MPGDLFEDARSGQLAPIYVVTAADPLLSSRAVAALLDATVPPASRAFNFDQIEGKGASAARILGAAQTLPMMGKRRLVLVRDAEAAGADALTGLVGYLESPSPETVLLLLCGKIDGRLKFFAAAKKKGVIHELTVPRQLTPWIVDEARRAGAKMPPDAARRLEEVIGKDLSRLAGAIEQLSLYAGEGQTIGVEHVDALIADTSERSVFQLTDAVGQGDRRAALGAVSKLLDQRESSIGVVIMLARYVRQLALYQGLMAERAPAAEMARAIGVPPFVLDKMAQPARRFHPGALAHAMRLLAQADRDLKGPPKQALGEDIVLSRVVEKIVALAR